MLQVYDRVLASSNKTTLLMLTILVLGLYLLSGLLEFARSSVLIRVGNRFDMLLNKRVFTASFEQNLKRGGRQSVTSDSRPDQSYGSSLPAMPCSRFSMRRGRPSI